MKRSPLKRSSTPIKRTAMKQGPSKKRAALTSDRSAARSAVITRARGECEAWGIPDIEHDHRGPRLSEGCQHVHELQGGSRRAERFTDPDWCLLVCPCVNAYVSNGSPREAERRGLRVPSWAGETERDEAAVLRDQWRHGLTPIPSWWPAETSSRD